MRISHRAYHSEGDDFKKLCQFIIADNRVKKEYFNWSLGRIVDWKYGLWSDEKRFPTFFRKNAELWLNYFDELVGFAISENGDRMFSIFVKEGYAHLYADILRWVLEYWGARAGKLLTEVIEIQHAQMHTLEQFGFISKGVWEVTRMFDLRQQPVSPRLPEGFTIADMAANNDLMGKATLQVNAFRNACVTNIDLLAREYVHESPIYRPEFDLFVLNAQGEHVAGCEAFIDNANGVAEIERVCTRNDYRRRGLAQAVIHACFERLRAHGIATAYITGGNANTIDLYGKLGHVKAITRIYYEFAA